MTGVLALVLVLALQSEVLGVAPVPTRKAVRSAVLRLLKNESSANIVELGVGWGGMAADFTRSFQSARIIGYERAILPCLFSKLRFVFNPRVTIDKGDIFEASLSNADIVFCYLTPWHMEKLSGVFDEKLKAGSIVVSASFPIPDKTPAACEIVGGIIDVPVYLYRW